MGEAALLRPVRPVVFGEKRTFVTCRLWDEVITVPRVAAPPRGCPPVWLPPHDGECRIQGAVIKVMTTPTEIPAAPPRVSLCCLPRHTLTATLSESLQQIRCACLTLGVMGCEPDTLFGVPSFTQLLHLSSVCPF